MKKVALVFVVAVLAPSLVLAWLAVRSLRDQQFLLERQQSLLDQRVTDTLAQNISDYLARQQQDFSAQVESLAAAGDPKTLAAQFDDQLRQRWPLAEVGFCVTAAGKILSPLPNARPAAQMFRLDNSGFLGNREPVEVYSTANNFNANGANTGFGGGNANANSSWNSGRGQANQVALATTPNPVPPAPPPKPELATTRELNAPAMAANVASQAFTLDEKAAKVTSSGQSTQSWWALNGSYANTVSQSAQRQQPLKPMTRSAPPKSYAPSPPPATAGNVRSAGFSLSPAHSAKPTPSATTANPMPADLIPTVSQPEAPQLATAKALPALSSAAAAAPQPTLALDDRAAQKDVPGPAAASGPHSPDLSESPGETPGGGTRPVGLMPQSPDPNNVPSQPPPSGAFNYKAAQSRKVSPQSQMYQNVEKSAAQNAADDGQNNLSKVVPAEAEFRQLIGDQTDGILARFLQNKLKLMCWHRLGAEPNLIFGAQLDLERVVAGLRGFVQPDRSWGDEICLAVLDDNAKPVVVSRANFPANWKRPFVATEVGDALPHWEAAAYLVNPAQLTQAAQTARLTLGLLIAVLVIAIGTGSLLIVRSLGAELKLARQKTDFVGNVSHELKTPLTSIRMFSELLAEGRVADPAKQHSYLQIITAEAARLTRLINNVLDFSRIERGEKKYNFQPCDLTDLVRATAETFRPHLESAGFQFACELPAARIPIRADADALSQIIVNLLSNAEKYSSHPKEILLQLAQKQAPLPYAEIKVLDRGPGVPRGCEEKVFEKFYRAHDSLSSGIQGSGLGLTIARQIARAHGGDVVYEPRAGGGSCFVLRLPLLSHENQNPDR